MFSKNPLFNLFCLAWHYSFDNKKRFVLVLIFSVLSNIIWLLEPIVIGRIFNTIQLTKDNNQVHLVAWGMFWLIAITVIGWLFHGLSRVMENENAFLIRKNYRQTLFNQVMNLPTAWHKDHHSGDTIDKINKASEGLYDFSAEMFIIIQNIVGLIASMVVLAFYDLKPILIVIFAAFAAVLVIFKFDQRLLKGYRFINKIDNFISAGVFDYISNYVTLISLRLKNRAIKELDNRSMKHFAVFSSNAKINETKWFFSGLIITLMTAGVIFWNAFNSYRQSGVILIGTLFILYQYLNNIGRAFYTFAWKYSETVRQNAKMVAAEEISAEYNRMKKERRGTLPQDWKVLQIKKLFFTYKEGELKRGTHALKDVSFCIERGKKIALIGMSGSGKSTVLSLLRGLHNEDSVDLYCDGKKMPFGFRHIHELITLIPQESEIFNNTIEYNITFGVQTNKKKLKTVIELAELNELISRLEKGLQTSVLEKGVSLSGGEKQRLALARGLLAAWDSQFLLLDEPTSSVDVENELRIYQNIFKVFADRTIISAIHSLHLLRYFDYIYLFKEGRIVAEGTFSMLLEDENFKILWKNYDSQEKKSKKDG